MNEFAAQLAKIGEYGVIEEIHTPIVIIVGLPGAQLNEIILFEGGQMGVVFVLEREKVQILVFQSENLKVGSRVTRTNRFLSVPVGDAMLGAVIDPLGNAFSDQRPYNRPTEERSIDNVPLGMPFREQITKPFETGVTVIDMMLPLGKGQKELVIGDRKTGKTAFLLQSVRNQVAQGTVVVYAAIAKKKSDIKKVVEYFEAEGISDKICVVASSSYDAASLIYMTPYNATTIAEYFRDKGMDVLVVLDDLTSHAKFYREVSLLAKRFPGRESYPGDIFYTHARLMERAGCYKIDGKISTLTMLPVAELVEGDFTGYIPTNLMGMTDGHLYFDSNIYYNGRRPALNIALSVTRVGRQTQTNLQRSINRELTAFLALYEKMQNLSHFGAELTDTVKQILVTGAMIYDFFEQPASEVVPSNVQLVLFSMLWLKFFEKASKQEIAKMRSNLVAAYQKEENRPIFQELINTETFNNLLSNVMQKKQQLIEFAGVSIQPQQAPAQTTPASAQSAQAPASIPTQPANGNGTPAPVPANGNGTAPVQQPQTQSNGAANGVNPPVPQQGGAVH